MTSPPADTHDFRAALGRFASGVTVVTTRVDGVDHAMTASAFSSVSINPPQVLICVDQTARFHDAVLAAGHWAVSILSVEGQVAASWFATRGRELDDQLARVAHHRGEWECALLDDAIAWLECETRDVHRAADHTILVGHVVGACSDVERDTPLLYYRAHYGSLVRSQASEKTPNAIRPERDTG